MLFFFEIGSRRVHLAGCTRHPTAQWVTQQTRNRAWKLEEGDLQTRFLLRDRDTNFTAGFDDVFGSEGVRYCRTTRSPIGRPWTPSRSRVDSAPGRS